MNRSPADDTARTLVAGVGNIFLGDDGFGVEVARRLVADPPRAGVRVADYGIRGLHLAYELLDGYDALVLIDAVDRGGVPGTVYVIEPEPAAAGGGAGAGAGAGAVDGHGLTPEAVLRMLAWLGGELRRVLVVGCQVADVGEGIGLSPPVARAVDDAAGVVRELLDELLAEPPAPGGRPGDAPESEPGSEPESESGADPWDEPGGEPGDESWDGPGGRPRDETTGKAGPPCSRSL